MFLTLQSGGGKAYGHSSPVSHYSQSGGYSATSYSSHGPSRQAGGGRISGGRSGGEFVFKL